MLVNFSFVLLALSVIVTVAAAPAKDYSNLKRRIPPVIDGKTRRPRRQSRYDPIWDVCPGSVIDSGDYGDFSWYLYYSPEEQGTNCAMVRNRSGRPRWMYLALKQAWETEFALGQDQGTFRYYVGPVNSTQANGHCLDMFLRIDSNDDDFLVWKNMACG